MKTLYIKLKSLSRILAVVVLLTTCSPGDHFDYPLIFTGEVTNIKDNTATFTAKITTLGKDPVLKSGFIYSLYPGNNNGVKVVKEDASVGVFSLQPDVPLLPDETYYVRAFIETNSGVIFGKEVNFKTTGSLSPGSWSHIFTYQIPTSWSEGCEVITAGFNIGNSIFVILLGGQLYKYDITENTLTFLQNTQFSYSQIDFSVVYNGFEYIFSQKVFYKFDPVNLTFTMMSVLPDGKSIDWASGFIFNDDIYTGIGPEKQLWKYNITGDTWELASTFPGDATIRSFCVPLAGKGYFGDRMTTKAWSYDPGNDHWLSLTDYPVAAGGSIDCTSTAESGYYFIYNDFYEYYPLYDFWSKKARLVPQAGIICYPKILAIEDKIYSISIWNTDYTDNFEVYTWQK